MSLPSHRNLADSVSILLHGYVTYVIVDSAAMVTLEVGKVGNDQKKAQSERDPHSKNRGGEKN